MRYEFLTRANVGALHTLCTNDQPEFASANVKRQQWFDDMFAKGLRGWVAFKDRAPIGYVEYIPIDVAPFPVNGRNANFLTCLWVLPAYQHTGVGGDLLAACLGDSTHGVATIAYEGAHKPADFFVHFGFRPVERLDDSVLLVHGPAEAELQRVYYRAHENAQRLAVDVLFNPECPWSTRTAERLIASIKEHPAHDQVDLWVADAWACGAHQGLHGGIYFNGVQMFKAPPSEQELARAIDNALTIRVASDT